MDGLCTAVVRVENRDDDDGEFEELVTEENDELKILVVVLEEEVVPGDEDDLLDEDEDEEEVVIVAFIELVATIEDEVFMTVVLIKCELDVLGSGVVDVTTDEAALVEFIFKSSREVYISSEVRFVPDRSNTRHLEINETFEGERKRRSRRTTRKLCQTSSRWGEDGDAQLGEAERRGAKGHSISSGFKRRQGDSLLIATSLSCCFPAPETAPFISKAFHTVSHMFSRLYYTWTSCPALYSIHKHSPPARQ